MARVPLTGGAYQARSIIAGAQREVNLYPEHNTSADQAPVQVTHYPTPGLKLLNGPTNGVYPFPPGPPPPQLWIAGTSCDIRQYALTDSGNVFPTRDIEGAATNMTGDRGNSSSALYGIALDTSGSIYGIQHWATLDNTDPWSIVVYAPNTTGNVASVRYIHGTNTGFPVGGTVGLEKAGICVDDDGHIYAGIYNKIYKFAPNADGNATPTTFFTFTGDEMVSSLFFDRRRQWIWVSRTGSIAAVNVYQFNSTMRASIEAYDLNGVLQRHIPGNNVFAAPNNTTIWSPQQVSIGPDGSIAIANVIHFSFDSPNILVFAPNADGDVAPSRTIIGPSTGIQAPLGVAWGSDGTLFLADGEFTGPDAGSNAFIAAFVANADGDATPLRTIAGANTGLYLMLDGTATSPYGLAIL